LRISNRELKVITATLRCLNSFMSGISNRELKESAVQRQRQAGGGGASQIEN